MSAEVIRPTQETLTDDTQNFELSQDPTTPPIENSILYQWVGSTFPSKSDDYEESVVISFCNLHGLRTSRTPLAISLHDLTTAASNDLQISILGISEHQLSIHDPGISQTGHQFTRTIRKDTPTICQLNSSEETSAGSGRLMGGTGIMAFQATIGRLLHNGRGGDPMGRWSYLHLKRHNSPPVTIISVYQVCTSPTNAIGSTAWHQQRRALDQANRSTVHPRAAFIDDLISFISSLQREHHDIIVGGDWNDHLTSPNSSVLRLCSSLNLTDPWLQFYPDTPTFATHERGQHRIDSVYVSHNLLPMVDSIGYSPVGLLSSSDHRAVFLKLSAAKLFGSRVTLVPPNLRHVRSNDKQSVTTFIEAMYDHLSQHQAFKRSQALDSEEDQPTPHQTTLVESLDSIIGQASDLGERRTRKRRPAWYSIELVQQRLTVSYLRHYVNGLRWGRNRSEAILMRLQSLKSPIKELPISRHAAQKLLTTHTQKLQKLNQESRAAREAHLSTLQSTPSHRINRHEIALSTWKTLRYLKTSSSSSTLDQLDIPDNWPPPFTNLECITSLPDPKQAPTWKTITNVSEIEYYLLLRNRLHFGQAKVTPFAQPPFKQDIPWGTDNCQSNAILDGTYVPPSSVPKLCTAVLQQSKQRFSTNVIEASLNLDSFKGKIRKWRESTTTSPSGRHLGRYKALFSKGVYDSLTPDELSAFTDKQAAIAKLLLKVINFCIRTGYVLKRWQVVVNTMIFKDQGNFKIHRLRVLHIYEADLNLIMAVKWRDLLKSAETQGHVNTNQHGARPGCEASTLALSEELRTDIAYSTRRTLVSVDNDASDCFDRMLPPLVSLTNRAYGMPRELATLHGNTLKSTRYYLRTAKGLSDNFYSHCDEFPIYGTGQGSGNSPVLWLLLSATLFDIHTSMANGAILHDPSGTISLRLSINGFVDDTNACVNDWRPQHDGKLSDIMDKVTHDAQLWNDLLFTSGGKLEISKCSFHTLQFTFAADGTPSVNTILPRPITIRDSVTNQPIQVNPLSIFAPHKTLGHWKSPAGQSITQLKILMTRMKTISIRICTSWISRFGARLAYHGLYVAVLRYVLPQCHFPIKTLRKSEKQSLPSLYAKCGFSRKTPQALLFAPLEYAGGGFLHWDTLQGEGQIMHFIKHWRTPSDVSTTLRINLAWCQWQAGISTSILIDTSPDKLSYLEARWLPSMRQALHQFDATLTVDEDFVPRPERSDDKYIMDLALSFPDLGDTTLRIINYCRLYLHITTISEMFDASGTRLLQHISRCERPPWFDSSTNVTIQRRPSSHQIRTRWQPFCSRLSCHHVVGPWHLPLRLRRETYCSCHDSGTHSFFHWYAGTYWECSSPTKSGEDRVKLTLQRPTTWTPSATDPHDVPIHTYVRVRQTIYVHPEFEARILPSPVSTTGGPHDFSDHIGTLDQWMQQLLSNVQWVCPYAQVLNTLQTLSPELPLFVVSDGSSLENQHMSFGVTIGLPNGDILVELSGSASGPPSSHRAECTGCLAGAVFCRELFRFSERSFPALSICVASDNQAMIKSLTERMSYDKVYPNSTLRPDWDLLEEIIAVYRHTGAHQVKFEWVKGHQDSSTTQIHELPPQALFNIRSDTLATEIRQSQGLTMLSLSPLLSTTRCHLVVNGTTITGKYRSTLRVLASETQYFEYLTKRHHWDSHIVDTIDWEAFCMAARTYSSTEVHLLKLVHDKLPMRRLVSRHQPWTNDRCHYCSAHDTMDHLQTGICNPVSPKFRRTLLKSIRHYLSGRNCPLEFTHRFLDTVTELARSSTSQFAPSSSRTKHDRPPSHHSRILVPTMAPRSI